MKKMLLASAFALFGTFAMANEVEIDDLTSIVECESFKSQTECGGYVIICKNNDEPWDVKKIRDADRRACDSWKELVESLPAEQ